MTDATTKFEKYIKNKKHHGKKYSPVSISQYSREFAIMEQEQKLSQTTDPEQLIKKINQSIRTTSNKIGRRATAKLYLKSIGLEELEKQLAKTSDENKTSKTRAQDINYKVLDKESIRMIIKSMPSLLLQRAVFILYETACRRDELLNIRVGDWNPISEKYPGLAKQLSAENSTKKYNTLLCLRGKGGVFKQENNTIIKAPTREVAISDAAKNILCKITSENNLANNEKLFVFKNDNGDVYADQPGHLYKKIRETAKKVIGRENIGPHVFRHSRATHWVRDDNLRLEVIQKLLGHSDVQTTQIYAKLNAESAIAEQIIKQG